MENAYLVVINDKKYGVSYRVFKKKEQIQQSIDITWSRSKKNKPELQWLDDNGYALCGDAGDNIRVYAIHIMDEAEHL